MDFYLVGDAAEPFKDCMRFAVIISVRPELIVMRLISSVKEGSW